MVNTQTFSFILLALAFLPEILPSYCSLRCVGSPLSHTLSHSSLLPPSTLSVVLKEPPLLFCGDSVFTPLLNS